MIPEKLLDEDIVEISKRVLHLVSGQWTEDVALVARNARHIRRERGSNTTFI